MWTPQTPFEQRMAELDRAFGPPPSHPSHKFIAARAELELERDLSLRMRVREHKEQYPSFLLTRMQGGTQFPLSNVLRSYFQEYASRIFEHGPYSFPTSFNVVESFLAFSHRFLAFDLREEKEHLLRLQEYVDWYTAGAFPDEPNALTNILPEGVIHLYNMVAPTEDFRLSTSDSELVVLGVALARHSTELSVMAVVGESPAYPPDEQVDQLELAPPPIGKENVNPHPSYTTADRYFKELPGFARVIALVRFDLASRRYVVRYVNLDIGARYVVVTDDPLGVRMDVTSAERDGLIDGMAQRLRRYDPLLASLATLIYLPAFFIAEHNRVTKTTFATELHARRASTAVRKAIRSLGHKAVPFSIDVLCLGSTPSSVGEEARTITPPDLEFANTGFWKSLPSGDVGEDESGNPIVGKTWVERTETWSSQRLESFVVRKHEMAVQGPNPGYVYVMRSGSHGMDLYKIGRTQREPGERAAELTRATGVPTAFEVLARWKVGDVEAIEQEAHRNLRQYKVNKRREFFRVPLPVIIAEIDKIVKESA